MAKSKRGFASMKPEKQKLIASAGGKKAHKLKRAHQWTSEEARAAGKLGGRARHRNRVDDPVGNFYFPLCSSVRFRLLDTYAH